MKISEHANYLLNEYGRLQFDYAAYCKPDGESLRNEARNNLEEYIAKLEEERRWIPVSERLPDTKIVYDKFDVIVELVDIVNGEMIRHVDLLSYDYRNKSWNDDCGEFGFYPVAGVTHWRERPTPPEVQE